MTLESANSLETLRKEVRINRELPSPAMRKDIRCAAGVSRSRLALAVGVSEVSIGFYERGLRSPKGENLIRYVEALHVLEEEVAT